jgi:hypothetical protein
MAQSMGAVLFPDTPTAARLTLSRQVFDGDDPPISDAMIAARARDGYRFDTRVQGVCGTVLWRSSVFSSWPDSADDSENTTSPRPRPFSLRTPAGKKV